MDRTQREQLLGVISVREEPGVRLELLKVGSVPVSLHVLIESIQLKILQIRSY